MRLVIGVFAVLLSSHVLAQECTTTVLASFYDQLTKDEIETLKPGDLEIKIDGQKLPVLSASRDFNNRLLILLETEGSAKNEKLADLVSTVTQQARQAPAGKPVAFGVFAEKATFTKGFSSEPEMRTAAINEVVEGAPPLGKRVALWDALHEALSLFGPHQPGDTVLLVGDPYDDSSHRSPESVEKEFVMSGTRLFMMRRTEGSRVERDFMWQTHDLEKMVLARTTEETGGLLSMYVASLIRFAWAGYMLEIKLPPGMSKPHKWKVVFRGDAAETHRKTNFYYPARFPACEQEDAPLKKESAHKGAF
ncbi:MAG TPA: hypothetical protein VKV30_09265 [Candidatus Angelobacter sp.]|nr:hypothetical protein [Candidatus Angelobacter sp.]